MATIKSEILEFVKSYYEENDKIPSIREICENLGISTKTFYKYFPKGIEDIAENLKIKPTKEFEKRIEKGKELKEKKRSKCNFLQLDEETQRKILTVSFVENKEASVIVNQLLEIYPLLKRNQIPLDKER